MKRMLKGVLGVVLCLCFVLNGISVYAYNDNQYKTMNESSWGNYYDNDYLKSTSIYLAPGSDDSQMNFSWFPSEYDEEPYVKISKSKDMTDEKTFIGTCNVSNEVPFSNKVTVTGLEKGATYYYRCSVGENETEVYSFKTTPKDNKFSALYSTDIHIATSNSDSSAIKRTTLMLHNTIASASAKKDISLFISGGDQANSGYFEEYIGLFSSPYIKSMPFALTIGNHDNGRYDYRYVQNNPNQFESAKVRSLNGDDYWYVKGDVLFLVMDSNNNNAGDHYNFVKDACEKNPDVKWKVATFHHDLYGGFNENREAQAKWLSYIFAPIMDKFGIDLCLMGHSHYFTRTHVLYGNKISMKTTGLSSVTDAPGTIYFVSGSLNKPREPKGEQGKMVDYSYVSAADIIYNIIDFDGDSLTINSYVLGDDNKPFETFTLNKTSADGGHKTDANMPFWYPVITFVTTITSIFNKIGSYFNYLTETYFEK